MIVNEVSGVILVPKLAPSTIFPPVASSVRLCAPWTVLLRVILPGPTPLLIARSELRAIGPAKAIDNPVVATDPPIETAPVPLCVRAPLTEIEAAAAVSVPLLAMVRERGPPLDVVTAPPRTMEFVERETPAVPVVEIAPERVVVPVPANCVNDAAFVAPLKVTFLAEEMVILPTAVTAPIVLKKVISVPALIVTLCVPSTEFN